MSQIKLKLNIGGIKNSAASPTPTPSSAAPPLATPTAGTKPKFIFKTKSQPPTPAATQPPKTKPPKSARASKPSAKVLENKKRAKEDSDDDDASTISVRPEKKPRLSVTFGHPGRVVSLPHPARAPKTPITPGAGIIFKNKGKAPTRPKGEGYDSEASDREIDPTIEEEFIIRFDTKIDPKYPRHLQQLITEKKIGTARDTFLKWYHGDGRQASISVMGQLFAATIVDLPCVIEGMKSWDRRGQYKSADICQMLLVHTPVKNDAEARNAPMPSVIERTTYQYPHGLTAPMHNVRKRRFRKRLQKSQIEAVEKEMERLLEADSEYDQISFQTFDPDADERSEMGDTEMGEEYDEDAEGEDEDPGYFLNRHHNPEPDDDMDAAFEAEMEAAIQAQAEEIESATPVSNIGATPQTNGEVPGLEEDSGDESLEDGDDDADGEVEQIDEAEKARLAQLQAIRDDMADLEKQISDKQQQLSIQANPILKKRLEDNIRKLKQELQLKKSSIGEDEENE